MQNLPKVTVVIPTYNRAHLIEKSIYSVLNQTYKNLEVIVIDDASTDNTYQIVTSINDDRLKCFKNEKNLGPSKSRNIGIEMASGELIAFQDSDDEWKNDKLEKEVNAILNAPEDVAAVYCGSEFVDAKTGMKIGEDHQNDNFEKDFVSGSHLPHTPSTQTVLIKKNVLEEVGLFDERLHAAEDTELAMRVTKKYHYIYVNELLLKVARNHDSLMSNIKNYTFAKEIIIEKHKNFLSKKILWELCKEVSNYYVLKNNYKRAKKYLKISLEFRLDIKSFLLYYGIIFLPFIVRLLYSKKYKNGIPHPNFTNQFIKE